MDKKQAFALNRFIREGYYEKKLVIIVTFLLILTIDTNYFFKFTSFYIGTYFLFYIFLHETSENEYRKEYETKGKSNKKYKLTDESREVLGPGCGSSSSIQSSAVK